MLISVRSKPPPNKEMKAILNSLLTVSLLTLISAPLSVAVEPLKYETLRPTGRLNITKAIVRTGAKATLDWEITYPLGVTEVVDIGPTDSLDTVMETRMKIRMAGASYQPSGRDAEVLLSGRISSMGSNWQTLFHGTNGEINAHDYGFDQVVPANTHIDFSARGKKNRRSWTPSRDTLTENVNIIVLKDGDDAPSYTPAFKQGDIESHASSYVQNGKIVLGPRDLIYLIEVGQTNTSSSGFDMQDLVFVVTFEDVEVPK